MYADDTMVERQVSHDVDHSALQSDLDNLVVQRMATKIQPG